MASSKPEIQYVRFCTDGSAARQPVWEPAPKKKKKNLPKPAVRKKIDLYLDPLAMVGLLLAVVMVFLMTVGAMQLYRAQVREQALQRYIQSLEEEKDALEEKYRDSYDLEQVRLIAESMGMVPRSQVPVIVIAEPEPEEQPMSFWEHIELFLVDLLA